MTLPSWASPLTLPFRTAQVSSSNSDPISDGADNFAGARFGPYALRAGEWSLCETHRGEDCAHVTPLGSRRQRPDRGYGLKLDINPYDNGLSVVSS